MKRGLIAGVFLLVIGILVSGVLGEIYVGEVSSLYNLGDVINVTSYLSSNVEKVGFFNGFLVCGLNEVEIHKSVMIVGPENDKEIVVQVALDNYIIGNLSGNCFIKTTYGAGEARSRVFEIINNVDVRFNIKGVTYAPGDVVNITGRVVKGNGAVLDGFVEIVFEGVDLLNYGAAKLEDLIFDEGSDGSLDEEEDNDEDTIGEDEKTSEEVALELWKEYHPGEEIPPELLSSDESNLEFVFFGR